MTTSQRPPWQPRQRRWLNPYISRLGTLPDLILGSEHPELNQEEKGRLTGRVALYSSLVVELGSGSGGHLIERAENNPEALHVGFELRFKRVVRTAEKAAERELKNIVVLRTSFDTLGSLFPAGSIQTLFINFPDPWHKRRWRKHRMLSDESLVEFHRLLATQGSLSFKTDHREYFDEVVSAAHASGLFIIEELSLDLHQNGSPTWNVITEFEGLFLSQKLPIHILRLRKP